MKSFFSVAAASKTAVCYMFTATVCIYTVLDLIFGWGGLPDKYLLSFLLVSLAGGLLQTLAFTDLVIRKLRYTLRLLVFSVPYLGILAVLAVLFDWFPAGYGGAWALFCALYLVVLLVMTAGFEVHFRISGKKYDGLLGQYRAARGGPDEDGEDKK